MPPIHLLIKPASLSCNMRCSYCFSLDIADNRHQSSYGVMHLDTLEHVVRKALAAAQHQCTFAFQGGEPTLAGLDFFRNLIEFVGRHNRKRLKIDYAIQTNGYCIDRQWAAFLSEHGFLVGLSLDGVKNIHDLHRRDPAGKGTFSKVMRAAQLFNGHGVQYNILSVITADTVKNIGQIYGFFSRNHFLYQQYIPCLDPLKEARGQQNYSLTPQLYGEFLCKLFDLWYHDFTRGKRVSVRYFDNLMQMMAGYPPESCAMIGHCTRQIVVEADGCVYPCDFYVLDEYRLGNLREEDFPQIEAARDKLGFIGLSLQKSPKCSECRWYPLCRGGCRRDREPFPSLNKYCAAYKEFFEYAYGRMEKIAKKIRLLL